MMDFKEQFKALTGRKPLSWQVRLYEQHFAKGLEHLPKVIDLPTGFGKTMVMAIWLIARANHQDKVPTRLIYVVDRRTVVDQATDLAENLQKNFGKDKLAISTLRGQMADNREWSRDPSRPAIIIGTVDLIGSALLFSGYRSSYKRRPLEAGLLGQDSLLVLDEAHLSKPFEKLICAISDQGRYQNDRDGKPLGRPMQVIRMSATSGETKGSTNFRLDNDPIRKTFDLWSKQDKNGLEMNPIKTRFEAKKTLTINPFDEKDRNKYFAHKAIELARDSNLRGKRIVIFTRKPDDARAIVDAIRYEGAKKNTSGPYANSVEVLTGTMRGLERDELVKKPVLQRFLDSDEVPGENDAPVFLVSTSAGEVGFDLNADHMVSDATTMDSLIQRLGRVNRRGLGVAHIYLIIEAAKKEKSGKSKKDELELAIDNTLKLLENVSDVSPMNIAALKAGEWQAGYTAACTPDVPTLELTDILLDNWSMTSITKPMPGRPPVGPWLRGIADESPQTTIAWRAELDLPGFSDLELETIEEWFDTHRILTHETLTVPTTTAAKWFVDRWNILDDSRKSEVGNRLIIADKAGLKRIKVFEVINQLERKNSDSIRNAELILPASFGGIEREKGLLDSEAPAIPADESKLLPEDRKNAIAARNIAPDVADAHVRYREIVTKTEEGESDAHPLVRGAAKPKQPARFVVELESDDDRSVKLVSYVLKREKPDLGSEPQALKDHVTSVRNWADSLLKQLSIGELVKRATQLAADYHDSGKAREHWQRLLVFPKGFIRPNEAMGKSGGEMKRDPRGYRHEFGSLREFCDKMNGKVSEDVLDLALHQIATHHGRGRPHFPKGGFDPECENLSNEIHTEAIRRFARLQRKYGWWQLAWLENLLRCADALASAGKGDDQMEANND